VLIRQRMGEKLQIQKQYGLAWVDFQEAPLGFPPSFKFDRGTGAYDTSSVLFPLSSLSPPTGY
jgi:hypothetical protein